jgi:hypothetical protein
MRWYQSAWLSAPVMLLAVAAAAQSPAAPGADEAQVQAIVKSIYAGYNKPPSDNRRLPAYSPSTAALYKQYEVLTRDEEQPELSEFDHYCECQDYDEKAARLQEVTLVRVGPDLIDATARYVMSRGDQGKRTRIRFERTGSWKVHDIFWSGSGGSLRATLTETIAKHSSAAKPSAVAQPSVAQKPAVSQPSVAQNPPAPSPIPVAVPASMPAPVVSACGDNPRCAEVSTFVATVTDLRESVTPGGNPWRLISVTVRFRNTSPGPLVLGFVTGSGVVTDDRGNRYLINRNGVRGLGEVGAGSVDPKFALRVGESGDARLEFYWAPGGTVVGTRPVVEFAVREIQSFPGNQWQLGREYALQFRGFGDAGGAVAATAGGAASASSPGNGTAVPASATNDACAKKPDCFSSGPFMAEITRMNVSQYPSGVHDIQFSVRFRNVSGQPLVLAHTPRSMLLVDDQGNRYTSLWTNITEVRGMGMANGMQSDPSFVLQPGADREATYQVRFSPAPGPVRYGSSYNVDFAVEELELLPANQVRSVRQFPVGFHDVSISRWRGLRSLFDIRIGKQSP